MSVDNILNRLSELKARALQSLNGIDDTEALDSWRVDYLGRRGELTQILRGLSDLDNDDRRHVGSLSNNIKSELEQSLSDHQQILKDRELASRTQFDVTLPGRSIDMGRLHPTTQIVREICDAFVSMGFHLLCLLDSGTLPDSYLSFFSKRCNKSNRRDENLAVE